MKKTLPRLLPCIHKPNILLICLLLIGLPSLSWSLDCKLLNGVWWGTLNSFKKTTLTLVPDTVHPAQTHGILRFIDKRAQERYYLLNTATCRIREDKNLSLTFNRIDNDTMITMVLLMTAESGVDWLQMTSLTIEGNGRYETVSGLLTR